MSHFIKSVVGRIGIAFVLMVLLGIGIFQAVRLFQSGNIVALGEFGRDTTKLKEHVDIEMRLLSVDPVAGELQARLVFDPSSGLLDKNEIFLTKDVRIDTDTSSSKEDVEYLKGQRMESFDVVISTYGKSSDYPFDTHKASMYLWLTTPTNNVDGTVTLTEIPFSLKCITNIHGYDIDITESENSTDGYIELGYNIKRSASTKTFAIFIMVLMWLLAFAACIVEVFWATVRKIETTMFGWMGTLLFAMVPLRNAMPDVPPIGVFADYISFFWAEIIVTLTLVASIVTWMLKPAVKS